MNQNASRAQERLSFILETRTLVTFPMAICTARAATSGLKMMIPHVVVWKPNSLATFTKTESMDKVNTSGTLGHL